MLTKEQSRLIDQIAKYSKAANICERMARLIALSKSLRKSYIFACNYYEPEAAAARREKRESKMEGEAKKIAAELGAYCYLAGDPRGAVIRLFFPEQLPAGYDAHYIRSHCSSGIPII